MRSTLAMLVCLVCSGLIYLYPGSLAMIRGQTDQVLSDGTDITAMPYLYDQLIQTWRSKPELLFYGTLYLSDADGDRGVVMWFSWLEKMIAVFTSYFTPVEQISTVVSFVLIILNGLAMFWLGRYLRWPILLSGSLGFAWAFNAYVRARAKVHPSLSGIYHLPLIFLGLFLVLRGKSWRSLIGAMACFLLASTAAHYYLVTMIFLSGFFLVFAIIQPEFWRQKLRTSVRLVVAVLPALCLLGYSRWMALPPDAKIGPEQATHQEWTGDGSKLSPFMEVYRAYAIDYLGGDISLGQEGDLNPARQWVNDYILNNLERSNSHERTNGIRWTILVVVVLIMIMLLSGRIFGELGLRRNLLFFLLFAGFTFWMSLGPYAPIPELSPSYWLYSLVPRVRVPARAGINVHFAFLMTVGFFLAKSGVWKKRWIPWVFAALVLIDYFPLQGMPMAPVHPAYAELHREHGRCGPGLFFPFINPWTSAQEHYELLQRMRGSDCVILNQMSDSQKVQSLIRRFPPNARFVSLLNAQPAVAIDLERLARCMPLNWIVFHPQVPINWALDICRNLGWTLSGEVCVSPTRNHPVLNSLEKCL